MCCVPHNSGSISSTILFRVARTRQQACVACIQFVTLHDFSNVLFLSFGVQFVRNMPFALHHAWRLLGFRSVVDEHVCWSLFSCAVNSFIELHLYYIGPHVEF